MEKWDWKKIYKNYYTAKEAPVMLDVPSFNIICLEGEGDPNLEPFGKAVQALYSISYTLKFMLKKEGFDYGVMPLEGLWDMRDGNDSFDITRKSELVWKIFIAQPPFVTEEVFEKGRVLAVEKALKKKESVELLKAARLELFTEGRAVQIMHYGPYNDEPPTVEKLRDYISARGLNEKPRHHEIYLTDPRRSEPSKMKTIIRHPVK